MGVTTASNSLILGGRVTNVLNNGDKKWGWGGVEGWVTTIFRLFRPIVLDKNATFLFIFIHICLFIKFKKLYVGQFFLLLFVKFRNS